jgi:predicted lipoprotein with Yx(FWY)xxD motif
MFSHLPRPGSLKNPRIFLILPAAGLAVTLAACGAGANAAPAAPNAAPPAPAQSAVPPTTVAVGTSGLGQILVDSSGRTLYLFQNDTGTTSACSGACATAWPPLRAPSPPVAGNGVNTALLGTSPRSDGGPQVTYNGHPLYLFIKDQKPGDTHGEGVTAFGASFFAVSPAGSQISTQAPSGAESGSSTSRRPETTPPSTTPPAFRNQPAPVRTPAPTPSIVAPRQPVNPVPQNGGGDHDADNNGGPSDGDGNI